MIKNVVILSSVVHVIFFPHKYVIWKNIEGCNCVALLFSYTECITGRCMKNLEQVKTKKCHICVVFEKEKCRAL